MHDTPHGSQCSGRTRGGSDGRENAPRRVPECDHDRFIETDVRAVASPEQVLEVRPNRVVLQSRVNLGSTAQPIGVFVDVDGEQRIDVVFMASSTAAKNRSAAAGDRSC